MSLSTELLRIFELQHGVASSDQMSLARVTPSQRRAALRRGDIELVTPRVVRRTGVPVTDDQRAMVAVLDAGPGAVLSHHSSLARWGTPGFALEPLHIIHPRGGIRRDNSAAIVHSSRTLPPDHIAVVDGIPITTPTRALFDVAPMVHPLRVARALDTLGTRRLLDAATLFDALEILKRPGRDTRLMEALLLQRGRDWVPPVSNVQRRAHALIDDDGQEPMEEEVNLGGDDAWIGRVDGWDRLAYVVMEIDSDLHHTSLTDRAADAQRDERFEAIGVDVVRVPEQVIWYEPKRFQQTMWQRRQEGRARLGNPPMVRRRRAA